MASTGSGFTLTRTALIAAIFALAAASIGCFVWAVFVQGTWNLVASALASAFLSIAVATLVTEVVLKPIFTADVLRVAGLRQRLDDLGLMDVCADTDIPWAILYATNNSFKFVVTRPVIWFSSNFGSVLNAARERSVSVDVYLPNPDSDSARRVAQNLGVNPDTYCAEVKETAADIESAWKTARTAEGGLHTGSTITIGYLDAPPVHSLYVFNNDIVLVMQPPTPERGGGHLALHARQRASSEISMWTASRWRSVESVKIDPPEYSDRRETPPLGGTGP